METRGKTEKRTIVIHYLDEAKKRPETYLKYRCWEAYGKTITPYKRANASTWQILEMGDDITVKRSDGSEAKFKSSDMPGNIVIECSEAIQREARKSRSPEETATKRKKIEGKPSVPTKAALKQGLQMEAPKSSKTILKRPAGVMRDANKPSKNVTIATPKRDSSASSSASSYANAHSDVTATKLKELEANFQNQIDLIRAEVSEWKQRAIDAEQKLQQLDKEEDIFAPFPTANHPAPVAPEPVSVASTSRETVRAEVHHPPSRYGPAIPKHKAMLLKLPPEMRSTRCYNCDAMGHIARDCQRPRNERLCYKCGKFGHKSFECQNAPANST